MTSFSARKLFFVVCGLLVFFYAVIVFNGLMPCVVSLHGYNPLKYELKKGQIFNPLKSFDFSEGTWEIYIEIHPQEFRSLPEEIPKNWCLKIDDRSTIESLKRDWDYRYTAADAATVQSSIYFLKNKKVLFESGILLQNGVEGLQSKEFGWIGPLKKNAISKYVGKSKKVYWPVLILQADALSISQ